MSRARADAMTPDERGVAMWANAICAACWADIDEVTTLRCDECGKASCPECYEPGMVLCGPCEMAEAIRCGDGE